MAMVDLMIPECGGRISSSRSPSILPINCANVATLTLTHSSRETTPLRSTIPAARS